MIQYRPRLRCQRRGLLEILRRSMAGPPWHPLWATSTAASAPASAPSSTRSPQPHRLPHSLSAVPKPAKSRINHSAEPADRGFGHPRLSGAYRQPKLFRQAVRPLLGAQAGKAAVQQATVLLTARRADLEAGTKLVLECETITPNDFPRRI